jgi:hypothetical protein
MNAFQQYLPYQALKKGGGNASGLKKILRILYQS